MNGWIGKHVDLLISQVGPPDSSFDLHKGGLAPNVVGKWWATGQTGGAST